MKLAYITNRIEMFRRRNDLSFNHHAEVAHLLPDEQDRWLERAAAGDGHKRWSVAELRKKMRTENKRQLDRLMRRLDERQRQRNCNGN